MGTKRALVLGVFVVVTFMNAHGAPVPIAKKPRHAPPPNGAQGKAKDACGPYEPGEKLSYVNYLNQVNNLKNKFDLPALQGLNASLDGEMTRALVEVFSNVNDKNTKVIYGSFTHPGSRKKNFGVRGDDTQGANQDEGEGVRVIFKRDVKAKDGTMRAITVILFYKPKKDGSGFELIEGGDAIRVRAELDPARIGKGGGPVHSVAGLAYDVRMKDGSVSSITAPTYVNEKNEKRKEYDHLQGAANPVQCMVCHQAALTRTDPREFDQKDPLKTGDVAPLLRKLNLDFGAEKATKLRKQLESPKTTFVPKGLLDALKKRCGN